MTSLIAVDSFFCINSVVCLLGLVSPIIARGLGPNPNIVGAGFAIGTGIAAVDTALRVIRGGRRAYKDLYNEKIEEFKIAVMLIEINGKEIVKPIFINRHFTVNESTSQNVSALQKGVKRRNRSIFDVIVNSIKVKRGSDGDN